MCIYIYIYIYNIYSTNENNRSVQKDAHWLTDNFAIVEMSGRVDFEGANHRYTFC